MTKNKGLIIAAIIIIIGALVYSSQSPKVTKGAGGEIKMGIILGFTGPIESLTPAMAASAELAF